MLATLKRIGQLFLLLVMLFALIGVNVKQLYCCHAHMHWEICWTPDEFPMSCDASCCEDGCCGKKTCHPTARYNFYKVTDFSQVESEPIIVLFPVFLQKKWESCLLDEDVFFNTPTYLEDEGPDRVPIRPQLGVYLC